jgi:para-aminobenzoate synthetase component 1
LDNHQYFSNHHQVECILAAGVINSFTPTSNALTELKAFLQNTNDWIFGHIAYDFKNSIEPSTSIHPDHICFPELYFFQPEIVIQLFEHKVEISVLNHSAEEIFAAIVELSPISDNHSIIHLQSRIPKNIYLKTIHQLQQHILRGDCYEINFCQEFYADDAVIDALSTYQQLTKISPAPFACYYKLDDKYLLCASPERYIKKTGTTIISQPIKGTQRRDLISKENDEALKLQLSNNVKERSENVMIVDLVRNDLSKVCKEASVYVEELFGIYTFPQVHQMISTITGELKDAADISDILKASFPMGSMTGAPKRKVMELIERYEQSKRGIYSGSVGYITPEKDFDFNVVIRSITYNQSNKYLSYHTGSAITYHSDPEKEYEECLLKAASMKKVFQPQ